MTTPNYDSISIENGNTVHKLGDKIHRTDGPAVINANGTKKWLIDGKYHREDGPAIEYTAYGPEWYINGVRYTEKQFDDYMKSKAMNFADTPHNFVKVHRCKYDNGEILREYTLDGKLHRIDGPAKEHVNGEKYWYQNGKLHRDPLTGPAIEYSKGDFEYYVNGKRHRVDGPARKMGRELIWIRDGKYHREDGPAYICGNKKMWYVNDKNITEEEFNKLYPPIPETPAVVETPVEIPAEPEAVKGKFKVTLDGKVYYVDTFSVG